MHCIWVVFILFLAIGCGKPFSTPLEQNFSNDTNTSVELPDSTNEDSGSPFKPSICSDLSFENVAWPRNISTTQLDAFALAMNISGSFEGSSGWSNLSNNFDGQGISLGLFNQNLGQGSLQPLLITFRDSNPTRLQQVYSASQVQALQNMLTAWGTSNDGIQLSKAAQDSHFTQNTSKLDDPSLLQPMDHPTEGLLSKASNERNQTSVDWSVSTVYTSTAATTFRSEWRTALQGMAGSAEYITLQVAAAKTIHERAITLMERYNYRQLRSYLFLFDIIVQNGGIPASIESQYQAWVQSNATATEVTKLRRLLELRLTIVRPEYVQDVRARKTAIINGTGTVHQSPRNFPAEYCTPSWTTILR